MKFEAVSFSKFHLIIMAYMSTPSVFKWMVVRGKNDINFYVLLHAIYSVAIGEKCLPHLCVSLLCLLHGEFSRLSFVLLIEQISFAGLSLKGVSNAAAIMSSFHRHTKCVL